MESNVNNPSVYLNEARRDGLDAIADSRQRRVQRKDAVGKPYLEEVKPTRLDLIKEAIDEYLERHQPQLQAQPVAADKE